MTALWIVLFVIACSLAIAVIQMLRKRRWHRRIARAHQPRPLPSTRDLVGSAPDITEGRSATDHIRRLRDDD